MHSPKHNLAPLSGGYSQRGANTQQNSRIGSQHQRQGYEVETITKFMKSKVREQSECIEVPIKVEDALRDDIAFIRSEVFQEIKGQKPYSCIIENTLSKIKHDPLRQLLRDLLALIEKEEERIKSHNKMSKSKIDKRRSQIEAGERRQDTTRSAFLSPDQYYKARAYQDYHSEYRYQSGAQVIPVKQQGREKYDNPQELRLQSNKKAHEQLKIECEDRVSQRRLKQLQRYIREGEKKRDQLNVQLANLSQLIVINKASYLKSRQENEKQKHNYASKVSEGYERNRLEEQQKERFMQNLQLAEEEYNNRRKEINLINQSVQQLHLEEEMLKQRKAKLSEEVEELYHIVHKLDNRIDGMNKQLSKLHAQYGRQSAHRKVKQKVVNESQEVQKPRFFDLKSTEMQELKQPHKAYQQSQPLYSIAQNGGYSSESALLCGEILESEQDYRQYLIQLLTSFQQKSMAKTRLLCRYDPLNQENLHSYVDEKPNILLIIQTEDDVFLAFYSSQAFSPTSIPAATGGIIASLSDKRHYQLLPNKRPIVYDQIYLIFGNSEGRISATSRAFSSQFGVNSGYYNSKGDNINTLLKRGKEREVLMKNYQIYQIFFRND